MAKVKKRYIAVQKHYLIDLFIFILCIMEPTTTQNNWPKKLWWIILAMLVLWFIAQYLVMSSKIRQTANDYEMKIASITDDFNGVLDKYEVEQIESCRSEIKSVIAFKAKIEYMQKELWKMQDQKNASCNKIKNKPLDVIDPNKYYSAIETSIDWKFETVETDSQIKENNDITLWDWNTNIPE